MRGGDRRQAGMFSYVSPERRIPSDHPLRPVREMTDTVLRQLSPRFARLYPKTGRPSVAPEKLLRALLLQVLYSVRSERLLMEQLEYNLLFRWFVGLSMDDPVWDVTVFTKNRERLLRGNIAEAFFQRVLELARAERLLSDEHFSVDGTQIQAWASMKSFRAKDGSSEPPDPGRNGEQDFRGEKRSNATHASTTDPEAKLHRKGAGKEAKLSFMGHALMENRSGLVVEAVVTEANGVAERQTAQEMIVRHSPGARRLTLGADKGYDARAFVADLRDFNVTPHVAQNLTGRRSAIDGRTTRHPGYAVSQQKRKRIEEPFGWGKTIGGLARPMLRGARKLAFKFTLTMAGYNLIRIPKLLAAMA